MKFVPGYIVRFFWLTFCGVILFAPLNLAAQNGRAQDTGRRSAESAFIYYAEGNDFALILRGEQTVFPAEAARGEGIILERSGIVNTGAGTFVEIQLVPSGTFITALTKTGALWIWGFFMAGSGWLQAG
jgi:hypothetical protein